MSGLWPRGDDVTEIMRYQTRVDSDDDWESVVLNLVRRPSGIAREGGGQSESPVKERELFIYPRTCCWAKPSLTRPVRGKICSPLLWHQASAVQRSTSEAIVHPETGATICPCSLKQIQTGHI